MKTNYFISETDPGFIVNLDNVSYIYYLESLELLWIYFNDQATENKPQVKEYKGPVATKLYNELKDYIKKN